MHAELFYYDTSRDWPILRTNEVVAEVGPDDGGMQLILAGGSYDVSLFDRLLPTARRSWSESCRGIGGGCKAARSTHGDSAAKWLVVVVLLRQSALTGMHGLRMRSNEPRTTFIAFAKHELHRQEKAAPFD